MLHKIARVLVIVGGINWGLVGLGMLMNADWNVIDMVLGQWEPVLGLVYVLVGVATVMMFLMPRNH